MKQLIISLGRQVGSGGHKIAEALAERFSPAAVRQKSHCRAGGPAGAGPGDAAKV